MGLGRFNIGFERDQDRHTVTDTKTGYEMHIAQPHRVTNLVNRVAFSSQLGRSTQRVPITNRDVAQYQDELPGLPLDPSLRYVEVAAGLGGLAEYVVRHPGHRGKRPVVIDPANYDVMSKLMDYALHHTEALDMPQDTQRRVLDLAVRCDVMRDQTRVRLLNMTFAEAHERHPDLRGKADVVVELYGASLYPDVEGADKLEVLEASERHYHQYVQLLRRDRDGEMKGAVCMTVPSRKPVVHCYGSKA